MLPCACTLPFSYTADAEIRTMVKQHPLTEQKRRDELDQAFKIIMSDGYILAPVLEEVIDEFRGRGTEYIMSCLDLGADNRTVVMKGTESPSVANGPVIRDTVFDVHLPNSRMVKVIVAVEGESKYDSDQFACARYIYYAARLISDQKGAEFKGDDYRDLKKVIVVWVNINPPKRDMNSLTRYRMTGRCSRKFSKGKDARYCDYIELVEICIGKPGGECPDMMGMLNTLFDSELSNETKKRTMMERYKIALTDRLLGGIDRMTSLTEQHLQSLTERWFDEKHKEWNEEGFQKGLEQGRLEVVNSAVGHVLALISRYGGTVDEAVETLKIAEDIAPEVKRQAEARLNGTSE